MRFDGYYSNPQYNDRYTKYLKFYPDGLVAGMNWEHGVPDLTRLRFSGSNTALGRGRWRLEDGTLHIRTQLTDYSFPTPGPGRRFVPRFGQITLQGPDGEDRLELASQQDLHSEWTPIERREIFQFHPWDSQESPEQVAATAERYLVPPAGRYNPADGAELVEVEGLWFYRYPVTVAQFRKRCSMPDRPSFGWQRHHPMVRLTYAEASQYAETVGARLPTEAEWQRAAAGPENSPFPWGSEADPSRLTMAAKATSWVDRHLDGASYYGALDMAGNAAEWCSDLVKGKRVVKGGGYLSKSIEDCRCDARKLVQEDRCQTWLGFRCVLLE